MCYLYGYLTKIIVFHITPKNKKHFSPQKKCENVSYSKHQKLEQYGACFTCFMRYIFPFLCKMLPIAQLKLKHWFIGVLKTHSEDSVASFENLILLNDAWVSGIEHC